MNERIVFDDGRFVEVHSEEFDDVRLEIMASDGSLVGVPLTVKEARALAALLQDAANTASIPF